MNTHIKNLVPIVVLTVLAALATMWLSSIGPAWAESPISPVSPLPFHSPVHPDPYVNECYRRCERWDQGNSACYRWCRCANGYESCAPLPLPPRPKPGDDLFMQECLGEGFTEEQCRAWHDKPPVGTVDEPPAPTPTPAPAQTGCPGWWEELDPWMGIYELRSNGTEHCIGPRIN